MRDTAYASTNGVPQTGRLLTHLSIISVDQANAEPSLFASGLALNVIASQPINEGFFRSRSDLWRLRYPLWKLALLAMSPWLVSAAVLHVRLWGKQLAHRRRQRRPSDRCRSCGYSRKGLAGSDRCPECGTTAWTSPTADQPDETSSR